MSIAGTDLFTWLVECSRCPASELVSLPPRMGAEDAEAFLRDMEPGEAWSIADEHLCPSCVDNGAEQDPQVWAAEAAGSIFRPDPVADLEAHTSRYAR